MEGTLQRVLKSAGFMPQPAPVRVPAARHWMGRPTCKLLGLAVSMIVQRLVPR